MQAIFQRLQSCEININFPVPCNERTKEWVFSQRIDIIDVDSFRYLVENHLLFRIEYSIHCTQLARDLLQREATEVVEQIETALMMAELLEHIYHFYLNEALDKAYFRREQAVYRQLLADQGYHFSDIDLNPKVSSSLSQSIREVTGTANLPRNFMMRVRRLLLTILPVASDFYRYRSWIGSFNEFSGPIFAYIAWIFYAPRALVNLFLLCKHLLPWSAWMSPQEISLGFLTRLRAQFERRWSELGNDIAWFLLGIVNCFILTGVLAPIAFYVSAALMAYDVGMAGLRAYWDISGLQALEVQYRRMIGQGDMSSANKEQIEDYLGHLQQRITYEKKRLYLQVINATILCLAFSLAAPFFAINPLIPLIGALVAVLVTMICYGLGKWIEHQKPVDKVTYVQKKPPSVVSHGFFKPSPDDKVAPIALQETSTMLQAQ